MVDHRTERGEPSLAGHPVQRFSQKGAEAGEARLPAEEPLAIEVNGQQVAVLLRTPGAEKALALGYALSEGLISSPDDILLLHHCGSGLDDELLPPAGDAAPYSARNRVQLTLTPQAAAALRLDRPTRWVFSGCGSADIANLAGELHVDGGNLRLSPEVLWAMVPALASVQRAYQASGGIHAAALFDAAGQLLAEAEDVGRHNAVDKAIGLAILRGRVPAAVLVATGRASSDIVAKAARVGIPVVASFSSSTSLGVRLAEAAGVTLIGYLRRNRFTAYTHPERIAAP